jgi:hypothetical protein
MTLAAHPTSSPLALQFTSTTTMMETRARPGFFSERQVAELSIRSRMLKDRERTVGARPAVIL